MYLSLHDPPEVDDDASDDVDLGHGVRSVAVPGRLEMVLLTVT